MLFRKTSYFFGLVAAVSLLAMGCNKHQATGLDYYNQYKFAEAAEHLEKAKDIDTDTKLQLKLANAYRSYNQDAKAAEWYDKALTNDPNAASIHKLHYAQVLRKIGNDSLAGAWYLSYLDDQPQDERARARWYSIAFELDEKTVDERYTVEPVEINKSNSSAFSPAYYNGGIIFCSERNRSLMNKTSGWTGRKFVDMHYSLIDDEGNLETPHLFAAKVNSPYDDGPAVVNERTNTLYFSRTNYADGEAQYNDNDVATIKIYSAKLVDGEWTDIRELSFNSDDYNCLHPALSADGKTLYFASNMPGCYGESDLFSAPIYDDGTVGLPTNLGPNINTPGVEAFPTVNINHDGTEVLTYSSTGHLGLGGLDIYETYKMNGSWSIPDPLSAPINSNKDDFGLIYKGNPTTGYFSSSRGNNDGIDNLYSFTFAPNSYLKLQVCNAASDAPLNNSSVSVNGTPYTTPETGVVVVAVDPTEQYNVEASKTNFSTVALGVPASSLHYGDTTVVVVSLDRAMSHKPYVLEKIYYEFDKAEIRPQAEDELEALAILMEDNPGMEVTLESHCDSRGTDAYNKALGAERAKAAKQFLVKLGVDPARINTENEGEQELVNNCDEGSDCSEAQHQRNRRTEIIVTDWSAESELSSN